MIWSSEVAQRYAQAFYDLAKGQIEEVLKDFEIIEAILTSSALQSEGQQGEAFLILSSPLLTLEEKVTFIDRIFKGQGECLLSQISMNFLKFLLHKNRMESILEIITAFRSWHDQQQNIVRGQVFSYKDLTDEDKMQLQKAMSDRLQKHVVLEYFKDSSLLGGLLVKIGSLLFDGTVTGRLNALKKSLISS